MESTLALADAISYDPEFAAAYIARGYAHHLSGDIDLALADYNKAIALQPENYEFYYLCGDAYMTKVMTVYTGEDTRVADINRAIENLHKAIELKPDYVKTHVKLGHCYDHHAELYLEGYINRKEALHALNHAIVHYTKALLLNPDNVGLYESRKSALESAHSILNEEEENPFVDR